MIDLSPLKGMRVDPGRRTVRVQAGLTLGEFDRETQASGLGTTMGIATDTGIAGLTLGGGYGWLGGKYGLACDNLLAVDVVTAEGQVVTVSESENADLFWGVRGGSGNFGIVTSFEYQRLATSNTPSFTLMTFWAVFIASLLSLCREVRTTKTYHTVR